MKNSWVLSIISIILLVVLIICIIYAENKTYAPVDGTRPAGTGETTQTPTETTQAPTETTQTEIDPKWQELLTYRAYLDMTPEERNEFYASFEDPNEFYIWFDAVKAIYEKEREENQIGDDGSIDMGDVDNTG